MNKDKDLDTGKMSPGTQQKGMHHNPVRFVPRIPGCFNIPK